jgi:hypothetical protein
MHSKALCNSQIPEETAYEMLPEQKSSESSSIKLWDAHKHLAEQIKTTQVSGHAQLRVLDESQTELRYKKVSEHLSRKTTPFTWGEGQKSLILRLIISYDEDLE